MVSTLGHQTVQLIPPHLIPTHIEIVIGKVALALGISEFHNCHYMIITCHFAVLLTLLEMINAK